MSAGRCTCAGSTTLPCWWCQRTAGLHDQVTFGAIADAEERAECERYIAHYTAELEAVREEIAKEGP